MCRAVQRRRQPRDDCVTPGRDMDCTGAQPPSRSTEVWKEEPSQAKPAKPKNNIYFQSQHLNMVDRDRRVKPAQTGPPQDVRRRKQRLGGDASSARGNAIRGRGQTGRRRIRVACLLEDVARTDTSAPTMNIQALLAFLAVVHRATGWVSISQSAYGGQIADIAAQLRGETTENVPVDYQQKLGYLWTLPEDTSDSRGLGGGIAWAWDPNLCDSILDQFSEDFFFIPFITCVAASAPNTLRITPACAHTTCIKEASVARAGATCSRRRCTARSPRGRTTTRTSTLWTSPRSAR